MTTGDQSKIDQDATNEDEPIDTLAGANAEEPIAREVVEQLHEQHGEELVRFLIGLLRDVQLARDVAQAAFAKMVEVGHTTREESRKGWLFRVAYNEAMLFRRREATGDKILRKVAWSRETVAEADDPLVRQETVALVREAMSDLTPGQLQVVQMRIYEEKTFAVIAEELDIPLGTALGRMRSAMQKMRTKLDKG